MHYKNGREAKNGDKIIWIPKWEQGGKTVIGSPITGILYNAVVGNDYCNGRIAPTSPIDAMPNLKECYHIEDVNTALSVTFEEGV